MASQAAQASGGRNQRNDAPFVFKGSSYTLTSLRLNTTDLAVIATDLAAKVAQARGFFENAPVVIDLEDVPLRPLDLPGLIKTLRSHDLIPVGVRGGSEKQQAMVRLAGLPMLRGTAHSPGRVGPKVGPEQEAEGETSAESAEGQVEAQAPPQAEARPEAAQPAAEASPVQKEGRLITQPVRSGQQVYAADSDLVVLAAVNHGAEILADGHVHAYAPLRGKVLAGVRGNTRARIFALRLEAQLVSVAGVYQVLDDEACREWKDRPVQIYLDGDTLKIEAIG